MDPRLRPARPGELDAVCALIARAFAAEPFSNWVAGGDPGRLRRFVHLAVHQITRPAGEVLVERDLAAAVLVLPPGALDFGPLDQLRQLPHLARTCGLRRLPTVLRGLVRLEREHPAEPHTTLLAGGVEPGRQGQGLGGELLGALAGRYVTPLYLETSSPRNVRLYERHGFAVRRELALPGGGPPVWTMLRPQRTV